jgi:hypothetical protein
MMMKRLLKTVGAAAILLGATGCSELTEYAVQGYVDDFDASDYTPAQEQAIQDFTLYFTLSDEYPTQVLAPGYERSESAIRYFEVLSSGLNLDILSKAPANPDSVSLNFTEFWRADGIDILTLTWVFTEGSTETTFTFEMRQRNQAFIIFDPPTSFSSFPQIATGAYSADARYRVEVRSAQSEALLSYYVGEGEVYSVSSLPGDIDQDEVLNRLDACPASDTSEIVSFDWLTTDVPNRLDESGCTIMDRYAACRPDEEQGPVVFSSRRSFSLFRGPSYCEKQVAYDLVSDGIIDYSEARTLRDALYQHYRSGGSLGID